MMVNWWSLGSRAGVMVTGSLKAGLGSAFSLVVKYLLTVLLTSFAAGMS